LNFASCAAFRVDFLRGNRDKIIPKQINGIMLL